MCGIAGSIRWDGNRDHETIARMTAALTHRGPDAGRVVSDGFAVLGHRRLAVIDTTTTADQPMHDPIADAWIVFNGEIYNFRSLRRDLEQDGDFFVTDSDTEVLLKGLVRHGIQWISKLIGMFAFAFWRPRLHELILARDRLGKKPLYYQSFADGIVFSSELSALRIHPLVSGKIDPIAIGQYLSLGYTTTDHCILSGVKKLSPGHTMTVVPRKQNQPVSYWDLAAHVRSKTQFRSFSEAAEGVGAMFDDAVRIRMISDVPLGAFLSGGIDSAAIVESMKRHAGNANVNALTIDFDISDHSEASAAAETASILNVHQVIQKVGVDTLQNIENIVGFADEPFADTSMLPFFVLSQRARQHMTVALSGDGGDELFAGYVTYAADRLHSLTRLVPVSGMEIIGNLLDRFWRPSYGKVSADYKLKRFVAGHSLSADAAHCFWRGIFDQKDLNVLVHPEHNPIRNQNTYSAAQKHFEAVADCHPLNRATYVDIKTWLVDDILYKCDRMSMAHGLEVRTPFLDHRLVEMAASLPPDWKFRLFRGKRILKHHLSQRLPKQILARKKTGFNAPVGQWFNGPFGNIAYDITLDPVMHDWFDSAAIKNLWWEHRQQHRDNGFRLFTLMCLSLWLKNSKLRISAA